MIDVETFPIKTVGDCKISSPLDKTSPFVTDDSQILYEHDMVDIRAGFQKDIPLVPDHAPSARAGDLRRGKADAV